MSRRRPLYARLLRLEHVGLTAWQRAALGEGPLVVAVLLVLADLATAWTLLVLPLVVAATVKAHDVLAGLLAPPGEGQRAEARERRDAAPEGTASVVQGSS